MALPWLPPWTDQNILLYHGCAKSDVKQILKRVNVNRGRQGRDFGRGFYTTTNLDQARDWAHKVAWKRNDAPAVIEFDVERNELAILDSLFYVRGDPGAVDFWSFVNYCRTSGGRDHNRTYATYYDIVAGPVPGTWEEQTVIATFDQVSFHTKKASSVLDKSNRREVT